MRFQAFGAKIKYKRLDAQGADAAFQAIISDRLTIMIIMRRLS
jgi:hypothetical protein